MDFQLNISGGDSLNRRRKLINQMFGDVLSEEQVEQLSSYIIEKGMLHFWDYEQLQYVEEGDNVIVIERSIHDNAIIHNGTLIGLYEFDQETGNYYWIIMAEDGTCSSVDVRDLPYCLVYKHSLDLEF